MNDDEDDDVVLNNINKINNDNNLIHPNKNDINDFIETKEKDQTYYESVLSNLEKEKDDTISKLRNENTKFSNENQDLNLGYKKDKNLDSYNRDKLKNVGILYKNKKYYIDNNLNYLEIPLIPEDDKKKK